MNEQLNSRFLSVGKQLTDTVFKAHGLAVENVERVVDLQMKTVESNLNAAFDFWATASEVRDLNGLRDVFPKGSILAKESAESIYATSQEVFSLTIKTNEAIGEMVKVSVANAGDVVASAAATVVPAKKASK